MNIQEVITRYNEAVFDTDREQALKIIHQALADGLTPEDIVFRVLVPAIETLVTPTGEQGDMNLAQHFMVSQIAAEVTDAMVPLFQKAPEIVGRVVIGTAHGDLHSLGKRIVMGCLKARMIECTDLGVNVPAERFVDEAVALNADVIAISSMMVHTARGESGCRGVRRLLRERHLEDRIKILVGGAPYRFDPELFRTVEADAWADNGVTAGEAVLKLIGEVRK